MRTTKLFTSVLAGLALMYSSGCCKTYGEQQPVPVYNCPPGYQINQPVAYQQPCPPVAAPAPVVAPAAPAVECVPVYLRGTKAEKRRFKRSPQRFAQQVAQPQATYVNYVPGYGTATLLQDPNYVPEVVNAPGYVAPAYSAPAYSAPAYTAPVAAAPVVAPASEVQGDAVCRTVYRKGRVPKKVRRPKVQAPVYCPPAPVYSAPAPYVEPYTVPAPVVEPYTPPVTYVEPTPILDPLPVYTQFVEPEPIVAPAPVVVQAPAPVLEPITQVVSTRVEPVVAPRVEPLDAPPPSAPYQSQGVVQEMVTQPILRPVVEEVQKPADTGPNVQAPIVQPVVIQPIIQPIVQAPIQQYSDTTLTPLQVPVQFQQPAQPIVMPAPPAPVFQLPPMPQPPPMPMPQPVYQAPLVSEVLPATSLAAPVSSGFEAGLLGSSYCPPDICPVPNPVVCAPGQNLSECFTLNEYQILNSPAPILVPDASGPLSLNAGGQYAMPDMNSGTASLVTSMPMPMPMPAPAGMGGTGTASFVGNTVGSTSKYEALVPPADMSRPDIRRPSVSMPGPLGGGENIPPVPPTSEIENALDAMLARDANVPAMLK